VLAVIHDAANGRFGFRRDLDKVEFQLRRFHPRLVSEHNPQLCTFGSDHAHCLGLDLLIDTQSLCNGLFLLYRVNFIGRPVRPID
jgi:hypothetical protein